MANMQLNEFVAYYKDLIGCEVFDSNFSCPVSSKDTENGLTKVKILTKAVELFFYDSFKSAVLELDKERILVLIDQMLSIAYDLGFKTAQKWLNNAVLPYSIGNSKIGDDTLVFNCSPALLCPADLNGYCNNCEYCYAKNNELQYGNPLVRNLLSLKKLLIFDIQTIIKATIKTISNDKKAKSCVFIRLNSNGDILDDIMLKAVDRFCYGLIQAHTNNLKIAYSYTHNKSLNMALSSNIVFNLSFKAPAGVKSCITAYKWENKYLDSSKYVICNGKCKNCSYCKDKDELRTIVFMAHGGGLKGLDMLPDGLIDVLNDLKAYDWAKFHSKLVNPHQLTFDDFL